MLKKNIKSALSSSLNAEQQAVKSRFEAAEAYFENESSKESKQEAEDERKEESTHSLVIRDSFTFPEQDYQLISQLRARLLNNAVNATKSEVLRAGLQALERMSDRELVESIGSLAKLKIGRPKKK